MKRFAVASMTVLALGTLGLTACGGGEKVKELEGQVQTLTTKNQELEAKAAETQKMLDECKAAAVTPTPEATPAPTGKTPVKTPAKTATPAPATPAPTPTPVPTIKPELKTKLKIK
jgi:outer membrane murein-binding lipoprotein Lpp